MTCGTHSQETAWENRPPKRKLVERPIKVYTCICTTQINLYGESLQSYIAYFVYFQGLDFAGVSDVRAPAEVYQGATPRDQTREILMKT